MAMSRTVACLVGVWLGFHLALTIISQVRVAMGSVVIALLLVVVRLWTTEATDNGST